MSVLDRVADAELFSGLSGDQRGRVAGVATTRSYPAGARLFDIGDEAHEILIVCAGRVELTFPLLVMERTREIRFQVLERGSALAWSALVPPHRLTMGARAAADTDVCAFPRRALLALFESEPAIGYAVLSRLSQVIATRLLEFQTLWVKEMQRNVSHTYR